jgi:hypothetical protein
MSKLCLLPALLLAFPAVLCAQHLAQLEPHGVDAADANYRGATSVRLTEKDANTGEAFAIVRGIGLHNGTIDVDVAGMPAKGAAESARGFIGIAFRIADGKFECIYVRPTNGRAADQLRRNHTTQYVSFPDWPWERLRKESPGVYESYTDMTPGEWTHLRIAVAGTGASLYVSGATQPCLLIHDLKRGDASGGVALWIGPGTEGYFRNLTVYEGPAN